VTSLLNFNLKNVVTGSINVLGTSNYSPNLKISTKIDGRLSTPKHIANESNSLSDPSGQDTNMYTDTPSTLNIFKASESKDLEKTKQILFELSDLVNTFSSKVVEQHQMTENSK